MGRVAEEVYLSGSDCAGLQCQTPELELNLVGSKNLPGTISRKVVASYKHVKVFQCLYRVLALFLPQIKFKWLWKEGITNIKHTTRGKMEVERAILEQEQNEFSKHL